MNKMRSSSRGVISFVTIGVILVVLVLGTAGCNSSSRDLFGDYRVTDLDFIARDIDVGEIVRLEVFFETKRNPFGLPDDVDVVLYLDRSLAYVADSSFIYDNTTSDRDRRSPDDVVECPDGDSFIVYRFRESELEDRGFPGGDHGLRLELVGLEPSLSAEVEAAADDNQLFGCDVSFDGEKNAIITVN